MRWEPLGPRALSVVADAKHELGVPYGKISRLSQSVFGLEVSRGALARARQRLAGRSEPVYHKLIEVVRENAVVFLYHHQVESTNAAAEREIGPAVRKMLACNRSPRSATTHEVLTSLIRRCRKQGETFLTLAIAVLRQPTVAIPEWLAKLYEKVRAETPVAAVAPRASPR